MFKSLVRATLGLGIDTFTAHLKDSNFVLGNAQATGWPIVYCSDGFCELTGYGRAQVMAKGCACKFLYGEETSDTETKTIDDALENKKESKTELVLYKKNGSPFWCLMDIVPIKNEKRQVVLFLVSHKDITREKNTHTPDNRSTDINDNTGSMDKDDSDSSKSDEDESIELPDNYNYSRRRSRAVLYHISGQLNKQNKAKSKLQQLNRLGSQMPEYKVQEVKKSKLVIVHYGIFKIGWDWLILLCTFYIAIMVPFNAAFRKEGRKDFMYVDAAVEVLFAIDIVLNFCTSFVNKNGQVCYDLRLIAVNYIRGWFLLDLLAAIPFDVLYAFEVETGTLIHLLKVARLLRLARLLQKIERYSQYSIFVVAILMCMFALLAHWLACIWYAIGKQEIEDNPANWTIGWLFELSERINEPIINKTGHPDTVTCYLTALYFTCSSLTSVGFGNVSANTNAEKIFSVCAMLVGAMMHAVVFGNVTAFIQRMYSRRATFHAKTKDLKEFFRFHHFPKPLKTRMQEYFQTMWSVNNGIDVRDIMKDFPEDLRGEISLHLNREILSLPIFENATQGCLRSVALQTNRVFFGPGEVLIHKGDAIRNIYYVCSGSLEVLKDEQVVAILGKGDLFGSDIKFEEPITISGCDVRSLAYCELLCINTQGLVECLQPYPEFSEKFLEEFPNDLTYNLREGHEDIQDDDTLLPAINTLPVISEDEEDEMSDEEVEAEEEENTPTSRPAGDEEETDLAEHSSTSPLLNKFPGRSTFPNGDIIGGLRLARNLRESRLGRLFRSSSFGGRASEPPKEMSSSQRRLVGTGITAAGGGSGSSRSGIGNVTASPVYMRTLSSAINSGGRLQHPVRQESKMRPCRTGHVMNSTSIQKPDESLAVPNLQAEIERTRTSVDKLERRLDTLCSDVKDMGNTLQKILLAVGKQTSESTSLKASELPSQAESLSASFDKPAASLNKVKTYMRDFPSRRVVDRQKSSPAVHQGVSPLVRQTSAGRPQFFFGQSPEKECFNDIFATACTQGTCGVLREEFSPSLSRGYLGGARHSPMSPLSQASVNSHTHLLGSEDEKGSPRLSGCGEHKNQYYKLHASDSEHDLPSTNGHSSSCSPQTPLSPYCRADQRTPPSTRIKSQVLRRLGPSSFHPVLQRQVSVSLPEPSPPLERSSESEESLTKSESLPLEPIESSESRLEEIRAPLSHAESFSDLLQPQDSTEV